MKAASIIIAEPPALFAVRPPLVVDCSLVCAVLFDEPERDEALQRMAGRSLRAPSLLDHEIISVALERRKQGWKDASVSLAIADYLAHDIELYRTDPQAQMSLAEEYDLSGYDAAYLWLAAHLKAPLATFDRRLGTAAQRHLSTLE